MGTHGLIVADAGEGKKAPFRAARAIYFALPAGFHGYFYTQKPGFSKVFKPK
jgi:hypothetical protein